MNMATKHYQTLYIQVGDQPLAVKRVTRLGGGNSSCCLHWPLNVYYFFLNIKFSHSFTSFASAVYSPFILRQEHGINPAVDTHSVPYNAKMGEEGDVSKWSKLETSLVLALPETKKELNS